MEMEEDELTGTVRAASEGKPRASLNIYRDSGVMSAGFTWSLMVVDYGPMAHNTDQFSPLRNPVIPWIWVYIAMSIGRNLRTEYL